MTFLRLINPVYVVRLERQLAEITLRAEELGEQSTRLALLVDADHRKRRSWLAMVADAMASGRTNDAKVMIDAMVLILTEDGQ